MSAKPGVRSKLDRTLRLLIAMNILVVALLALTMVADWLQILPTGGISFGPRPSVAASPSPTQELMQMGLAHIPTSNECVLCHEGGGTTSVKVIPAIGHPLEGWGACLICHNDEKLGREAPGHKGIAQTECLNCHKVAQDGPAITQAHAKLESPCLDCHGSVAHLPTSMVGRNQDECWLCHKPSEQAPPTKPHPDPQNLTCRDCHQGANAGALPINHAMRADTTCVLCHEIKPALPIGTGTPAPSAKASGG